MTPPNNKSISDMIASVINKESAEKEYLCAAYLKQSGKTPDQLEICTQITEDGVHKTWIQDRSFLPETPKVDDDLEAAADDYCFQQEAEISIYFSDAKTGELNAIHHLINQAYRSGAGWQKDKDDKETDKMKAEEIVRALNDKRDGIFDFGMDCFKAGVKWRRAKVREQTIKEFIAWFKTEAEAAKAFAWADGFKLHGSYLEIAKLIESQFLPKPKVKDE